MEGYFDRANFPVSKVNINIDIPFIKKATHLNDMEGYFDGSNFPVSQININIDIPFIFNSLHD